MDALGGNGNGLAWYADSNAPITEHDYYIAFSQYQGSSLDADQLKGLIGTMKCSAEGAPIINYMMWLLTIAVAIE